MVLKDPLRKKQLDAGLNQLSHEGVIQLFIHPHRGRSEPYLGAVGMLQFEVLKERLKNEYRVNIVLELLSFQFARWVEGTDETIKWLESRRDYPVLRDRNNQPVLLSESLWSLNYAVDNAPDIKLHEVEPL